MSLNPRCHTCQDHSTLNYRTLQKTFDSRSWSLWDVGVLKLTWEILIGQLNRTSRELTTGL